MHLDLYIYKATLQSGSYFSQLVLEMQGKGLRDISAVDHFLHMQGSLLKSEQHRVENLRIKMSFQSINLEKKKKSFLLRGNNITFPNNTSFHLGNL